MKRITVPARVVVGETDLTLSPDAGQQPLDPRASSIRQNAAAVE